jgi:light-regulated signal transduction histidine kinase (bacteriophytochrome)
MQQLINDLLTYSRVDTRGHPSVSVDCVRAVEQALFNLQVAIREAGARVDVGMLPTLQADETQINQLFQNLIGNAIKFHSNEPAEVRVWAERDGPAWRFAVRDNGIGIEAQYAERIFIIFQRLHGREQYSGTGIGLAVCKKIVQRHGGKIWFDSTPGKGSTFYFTIPDAEEINS